MQTLIPSGDSKAIKKWSASVAKVVNAKSYWTRAGFIGAGEGHIVQQLTDLQSASGELIQYDLVMDLNGEPTVGDDRLKGKEENLRFYSDQVLINQQRKAVSGGATMARKRTLHNLPELAKDRQGDYWARWNDGMITIYLSGARGIDKNLKQGLAWAGHASNPLQAPDTDHIVYGGSATSKASLTAADKVNRMLVERLQTYASMIRSASEENVNLNPISIDGAEHFVFLMNPYCAFDMRTADTTGWLEMNKALTQGGDRSNPIFKHGLGMLADTVLHKHSSVIRFNDYGAGGDVLAARNLFLGRQAGVIAYGGTKGARYQWIVKKDDYDNVTGIASGCIVGVKKARFNGRDFGVIAADAAAAPVK